MSPLKKLFLLWSQICCPFLSASYSFLSGMKKNSQHSWPTFVPLSSFSFGTSFTTSFSKHLVDMTKTIMLYFTKFLYFILIYIRNKPHEVSLENINILPFTYTETEPWKELTSLLWQDTEQPTVTSKAICDLAGHPFPAQSHTHRIGHSAKPLYSCLIWSPITCKYIYCP